MGEPAGKPDEASKSRMPYAMSDAICKISYREKGDAAPY